MWFLSVNVYIFQMSRQTYQVGPYEDERFVASRIDGIVAETVNQLMENLCLDSVTFEEISRTISEGVKMSIVEHGRMPRHKVTVQSVVARQEGQGMLICSKSRWNAETDNYSNYTWRGPDGLVVTVMVFCLYTD